MGFTDDRTEADRIEGTAEYLFEIIVRARTELRPPTGSLSPHDMESMVGESVTLAKKIRLMSLSAGEEVQRYIDQAEKTAG